MSNPSSISASSSPILSSTLTPSTAAESTPITSSAPSDSPPISDDDSAPRGSAPPNSSGLLNYYFLLLAILILIFFLVYHTISRRRKRRNAHLRSTGQTALARDLEGWPGSRTRAGARRGTATSEPEEGLNERGEAPPPYAHKMPEEAVLREQGDRGVPLRELGERKPPDYEEGAGVR